MNSVFIFQVNYTIFFVPSSMNFFEFPIMAKCSILDDINDFFLHLVHVSSTNTIAGSGFQFVACKIIYEILKLKFIAIGHIL